MRSQKWTVWRSHFWDRWPLSVASLFMELSGPKNGTARPSCFWDRAFSIFWLTFGGECILQMGEWCDCRCAGWAPPLLINMDETALGYHFGGLRGTILRQRADSSAAPVDRASLSDVRGHVSYLASICDDVTVQDLLPQVLLGNEHRFTKQVLHSMEGKCPSNVQLWRQKSAWNSHATMRRYVCLLAKNLGVLLQQWYVILLVDTASVHIHMSIYKLARQRGLRLVYVPAKMTRWLQPCDTHLFAAFKRTLTDNWRRKKSEIINGCVDTETWLHVILSTIRETVQADWAHAFQSIGLSDQQAQLSPHLFQTLGWEAPCCLPLTQITLEEARSIFPARTRLDFMSYIQWVPAAKRAGSTCAQPKAAHPKRRKLPPTFRGRVVQTLD